MECVCLYQILRSMHVIVGERNICYNNNVCFVTSHLHIHAYSVTLVLFIYLFYSFTITVITKYRRKKITIAVITKYRRKKNVCNHSHAVSIACHANLAQHSRRINIREPSNRQPDKLRNSAFSVIPTGKPYHPHGVIALKRKWSNDRRVGV